MSAKFFILYAKTNIVTPHIADEVEVVRMAVNQDPEFKPGIFDNSAERIAAADKVLLANYKVWGLYEYTPEGMSEFLEASAQADELAGIHAIEVAEEYIEEAQKALALALTEAQKKAMGRVQFPIAGDKLTFGKYLAKIAEIRELSVNALYEYVENGDEIPE